MRLIGVQIRGHLPEILFLAVTAAIVIYVLFIPPMVGIADSGDFSRLMNWFGLSPACDPQDAVHFYVTRLYEWHKHFEVHYPSTELLFIAMALPINMVLTRNGLFDIRVLGGIHVLGFLLVLFLLTRYARTLPLGRRLVLYALIAFMFADIGCIQYFNSFFCESASFIFLGATMACALALTADCTPGRRRAILLAGFFASAALLTAAKMQNFIAAFPLAVLGYRLGLPTRSTAKGEGTQPRKLVIALTVALVLFGIAYYGGYARLTDRTSTTNVFNAIFYELLYSSPCPESDAMELGLRPAAVAYAGADATTGIPDEFRDAAEQIGASGVARFYMRHPARFVNLLGRMAEHSLTMRVLYLSNYEKPYVLRNGPVTADLRSDLPPEYISWKYGHWSSLKAHAVPKTLGFLIAFILLNALVIVAKSWRLDRTPGQRMITDVHAATLTMAVIQFLMVAVVEGTAEDTKHLLLFNLLCEISFVFLLMYAATAISSICARTNA